MLPADEWPIVELFNVLKTKLHAESFDCVLAPVLVHGLVKDVVDPPLVVPVLVVLDRMANAPLTKDDEILLLAHLIPRDLWLNLSLDVVVEATQRARTFEQVGAREDLKLSCRLVPGDRSVGSINLCRDLDDVTHLKGASVLRTDCVSAISFLANHEVRLTDVVNVYELLLDRLKLLRPVVKGRHILTAIDVRLDADVNPPDCRIIVRRVRSGQLIEVLIKATDLSDGSTPAIHV